MTVGDQRLIFFKDHELSDFRSSLDTDMKRLQLAGLDSEKRGRTTHFGGATLGEDSQ